MSVYELFECPSYVVNHVSLLVPVRRISNCLSGIGIFWHICLHFSRNFKKMSIGWSVAFVSRIVCVFVALFCLTNCAGYPSAFQRVFWIPYRVPSYWATILIMDEGVKSKKNNNKYIVRVCCVCAWNALYGLYKNHEVLFCGRSVIYWQGSRDFQGSNITW